MSTEFKATLEYVASFSEYFARFAKEEPLFEPELAASLRIVAILRETPVDVHAIERELAEVECSDHYDGTGWLQFKKAVRWWLDDHGLAR